MEGKEALIHLYGQTFGRKPQSCEEIPACGSYRRYFRLKGNSACIDSSSVSACVDSGFVSACVDSDSVIGCWNADRKENAAFVSFARSFRLEGLHVPEIYGVDEEHDVYLQQDLGGETLYDRVSKLWLSREEAHSGGTVKLQDFPEALLNQYRHILKELVLLQLKGKACIDYNLCTPCPEFHRDAIHWDLNYFKYFFLKLLRVPFDEQALEDDFRTFSAYLLEAPHDYFLYRDFQSANVMLVKDTPWFIDFQGGRRGALQYDVASLLFDAKTRLPKAVRDTLANDYYDYLSALLPQIGCESSAAASSEVPTGSSAAASNTAPAGSSAAALDTVLASSSAAASNAVSAGSSAAASNVVLASSSAAASNTVSASSEAVASNKMPACSEVSVPDRESFFSHYQGYALCRLLQALAAFGFRGIVEKKPGFRESIPPALKMVQDLLDDWQIPVPLPELQTILHRIGELRSW